ncbi:MAG: molybdopterin-dependent oxidoreductase [Alphaproteobacteria bacterium]|nr:molybdopterin-dependent oxidoreductase [Alphaproteobacteria bacterium]
MTDRVSTFRTATHWGAYDVEVVDGRLTALQPIPSDPDPSPIGPGMVQAIDDTARIRAPMVRKDWLDNGPTARAGRRGRGPFVAVSWQRALDLVAGELERVRSAHGNQAIYAGSYGWASAGRFHHALGQIHRFMAMAGGYTASRDTYSLAAGEVVLPHVIGIDMWQFMARATSFETIVAHGELMVMFGGIPMKNAQVEGGGTGRHWLAGALRDARNRGVEFVNIGPNRADAADFLETEWIASRPSTDTAVMLGLAHTLVAEDLHDRAFLERCTVGFGRFAEYLMGSEDGTPKDADWAGAISGIEPETIRALARRMAAARTMVNLSWSVQRVDHGEQSFWAGVALAALIGQIGLPGGGVSFGYGAVNSIGRTPLRMPRPTLPGAPNPVESFIPVARIADMLLNPGTEIAYNGQRLTYPDIRLVYWAGGNPFHHHQDLNRLAEAWQRPETVVVHEPWWNASARHADIVLPVATMLERNDIGCSRSDHYIFAMQQAIAPVGEARTDYAIFSDLAARLGFAERFTEGRDEDEWLRHIYDRFRQGAAEHGFEAPSFDDFWEDGAIEAPRPPPQVLFDDFRKDPAAHPLATPSGRIELYSKTIATFGYDDCPGHPSWLEPAEWLGAAAAERFPLHLISNQPKTRLHSQYDNGGYSQSEKVRGREPIALSPVDAAARGVTDGDLVRVFNDRGSSLAGAVVDDAVMPGVVLLATGAWYDPAEPGEAGSLELHGNPNVLTLDKGTSKLAQGPSAQSALVEVERFDGAAPPVTAFVPPPVVTE